MPVPEPDHSDLPPIVRQRRDWVAVACAEHVRRGAELGAVQVCHGRGAPLRRLAPGDRLVYYSPSETRGGREPLRCFTALCVLLDGPVIQVEQAPGFHPLRRPARYLSLAPAPVAPLREDPGFAFAGAGWGARLRFGLIEIDAMSMDAIARAMGAELSADDQTQAPVASSAARRSAAMREA